VAPSTPAVPSSAALANQRPPRDPADAAGQRADNGRLGAVVDATYLRVAEATGGSAIDSRIPVPPGTPLIDASGRLTGPTVAVLARRDQNAGAAELVPFVVDAAIVRVDLRVRAPKGSKPVIVDSTGKELAPLRERNGYLEYGMLSPPSGNWRFALTGAEGKPYELEAQGSGYLSQHVTVSERGAEPGPDGPRRLIGRPALGVPYVIDVKLAVTKDGVTSTDFSQVDFGVLTGNTPPRWIPAAFKPELRSFRAEVAFEAGAVLLVRGKLPDGSGFQRIFSSVIASPYRLSLRRTERVWVHGTSQVIPVVVENHGPKAKLELFTKPAPDGEVRFDPTTLELDRGQSARVLLHVTPRSNQREVTVSFGVGQNSKDPGANRAVLSAKLDGDRDGDGLADRIEGPGPAKDDRAVAGFELPGLSIRHPLPPGVTIASFEPIGRAEIEAPAGTQAASGGFEIRFAGRASKPPSAIRLELDSGLIAFALVPSKSGKGPWERRGRYDRSKKELTIPLSPAEQRQFSNGDFTLIVAPAEAR